MRNSGGVSLGNMRLSSVDGRLSLGLERVRRATGGVDVDELLGNGLDNGLVDKLGTSVLGETNVQEEGGLEEVVEGHPVEDGLGPELKDVEGGKHDPVGEVLGVVGLAGGLQGQQRVVAGDHQSSNVGQQLADSSNVEENEDEVESHESKQNVRLGDGCVSDDWGFVS